MLINVIKTLIYTLIIVNNFTVADYCDDVIFHIPPCNQIVQRDILFLIDGSNSIGEDNFYKEILDYVKYIFCAFHPSEKTKTGVIIFNQEITNAIPLQSWSRKKWEMKIENIRKDRTSKKPSCCSCCTPIAEAFDMAYNILSDKSVSTSNFKTVFVITDGVPSNNDKNTGGNPNWWYYDHNGFNPAEYNALIVPQRALYVKSIAKLMFVGVPDKHNTIPDIDYFGGFGEYSAQPYTLKVGRYFNDIYKIWSYEYKKGNTSDAPNPIVSHPPEKNIFTSSSLDTGYLINQTIGNLCEFTQIPTHSPTIFPTFFPSYSPSKNPTSSPIEFTYHPTNSPSKFPTKITESPTTMQPTKFPTKIPTKITESPTTMQPTKFPTKITENPTTMKPTTKPTISPSYSPTKTEKFKQIDLTYIIDRSNSMNWQADFCQDIIDTLEDVFESVNKSLSPCWELFMRYILDQSDKIKNVETYNGKLGWSDEYTEKGYGLRVNIIGFWCINDQKTPKFQEFSEDWNEGPITSRFKLVKLLNYLRLNIFPDGGTCPGMAIEQVVKYVERTSEFDFPHHTSILVTDGVFYDMPHPEKAATGLKAYGVTKFAVGIAVAGDGQRYGMTKDEIETQRKQLSSFVEPKLENYIDLGNTGWENLLRTVTQDISDKINADVQPHTRIERYTWCGWRREVNCKSDNWRNNKCKWKSREKQYGCYSK